MNKKEMGKKSRRDGMAFERKVRADLEKSGWIVNKWTNNLEWRDNSGFGSQNINQDHTWFMHPAKSFRGITRSNGFPDFIAFVEISSCDKSYEIIAVESKMNGVLSKIEKEKCQWYLDNNIFSKIVTASKGKARGEIVYKKFVSKESSSVQNMKGGKK